MLINDLLQAPPVPRAPSAPKRRPWSPWILSGLLLAVLVSLGILLTVYFHRAFGAGSQLQAALAETDRLDPRWQLRDIEARRSWPADESNGALTALAAHKSLPPGCRAGQLARRLLAEQPPQALLPEARAEALRAELAKADAALADARKLKDFPRGRFPAAYAADFVSTPTPCEPARTAAQLLAGELVLLAHADEADPALQCVGGILGCARAVGDEPLVASQRIRMECRVLAAEALQRALAQGVPSPRALRAVQEEPETENTDSLLYVALRGERGGYDWLMAKLQGGEIRPGDVTRGGTRLLDRLDEAETGGLREQRAALLRFMNQAVQAAALDLHKRAPALRELDAAAHRLPPVARRVAEPFTPAATEEQRALALLRCAIVAAAAEHFRLRNGHWPAGPDLLKRHGYLAEVPLDPYDGAPLRWRVLEDGVVVYSLGPDGQDNGGTLSGGDWPADGSDVGFRLWDSARRRQSAAPAPPGNRGGNRLASHTAPGE